MTKVVILQEYVPQYRVPFFEVLHARAQERGVEISVAFGDPGRSLAARNDSQQLSYGVQIKQREFRILGRRIVLRDVSGAIADADLIILEQARRNLDAYKFLSTNRASKPLIALWGHGKDYTQKATSVEQRLSRWLTSRSDWFFAYTNGGMNAVINDGYAPDAVTVVQNSIDTATLRKRVRSTTPEAAAAFAKMNDLRGKTALFLGALDSSKRLPFLFEASADAHRLDRDYRLVIAGDGALRPDVEKWDRAYPWVKYLGPVADDKKALVMSSCQLLAVPGRVGLIAVDSFASGLPIVTTDWPWHAPEFEYLQNGENSIVTSDDPRIYARVLVDTLTDGERLERLRQACQRSSATYTVEAMSDRFLEGILGALAVRNA